MVVIMQQIINKILYITCKQADDGFTDKIYRPLTITMSLVYINIRNKTDIEIFDSIWNQITGGVRPVLRNQLIIKCKTN